MVGFPGEKEEDFILKISNKYLEDFLRFKEEFIVNDLERIEGRINQYFY